MEGRRRGSVRSLPQMLQFPIQKVWMGKCVAKEILEKTRILKSWGQTARSAGSTSERGKLVADLGSCQRSVRAEAPGKISVQDQSVCLKLEHLLENLFLKLVLNL